MPHIARTAVAAGVRYAVAMVEREGGAALLRRVFTDERWLWRALGVALLLAVWVAGVFVPRSRLADSGFMLRFSLPLVALAVVDWWAPDARARPYRRWLWLAAELALCFLAVYGHGTLVRPAPVYAIPAARAALLFGPSVAAAIGVLVLGVYTGNIVAQEGRLRAADFRNYVLVLLPTYVVAIALTAAVRRQAEERRRVRELYEQLQQAHLELRLLHERDRDAAIMAERNRLAREVHDTLGHYLTVIAVQLEAAERTGGSGGADRERVAQARRLAVECLQDVRRSVRALQASALSELTLPGALERLVDDFRSGTDLSVTLTVDLAPHLMVAPELSLAMYRAAQEGLTNVVRHAQAAHAWVRLRAADGVVSLYVEDDGGGPAGVLEHNGFGLAGLRERLALLSGTVELGHWEGGGARLLVLAPLSSELESEGLRADN